MSSNTTEQHSNSSDSGDDWALEEREWLESLDSVHERYGTAGIRDLLQTLQDHLLRRDIQLNDAPLNTPYRNTIPPGAEPVYPGDIAMEERIEKLLRWNAAAMVVQAADEGSGVGGHIATYTSAATMMEVGLHHIFRARTDDYGGDLVMFQPHASPGVYARANFEGRLSVDALRNFRRQLAAGGGLPSYPHPRAMPDFWEVPSASMGLSTPTAIYQARFAKYLENRGLKARKGGRVWCFIGDGESDEPEVLGTINVASREKLNNLVVVVNCNLQRLDGPVRGNGKIIQELERSFRGADWNVVKVVWGSGWDALFARDTEGVLQRRMEAATDGDYQYLSISSGDVQRDLWVEDNDALAALMNTLTDAEVQQIKRGGQDPKKIYAAYRKALESTDRPTVILVKSVKGYGLGAGQGQNTAHQKKQLSIEERHDLARDCAIPLDDDEIDRMAFYVPEQDSEELRYLREHRQALGGYLPARNVDCKTLPELSLDLFKEQLAGSGERSISTTMAVVRMLAKLIRDEDVGRYIVPIVPDEARTFGLEALFKAAGIYSVTGQQYTPVDGATLLPYKEARDGQILQEGICETGAMASFLAAGTAYAVHGVPTIPFYIFYSIFGFQRVGDMIWACGDMMCRGFLLGGTAGRTTLNGEGLQHQDGHSLVMANTVPNMKSYDPAFAYELAIIIRDGIRRMYTDQEKIFYYITVYNENYPMPAVVDAEQIEQGVLRGMYCFARSAITERTAPKVNLFGSGSIMTQVLEARDQLESRGIAADVWSVTSYNELYRNAMDCERWNRLHPDSAPRRAYIDQMLGEERGVYVAASDYMKALPNCIAPWIPGRFSVLGTDGFGLSEDRATLRDYFEVSPQHIVLAAIKALNDDGSNSTLATDALIHELGIDASRANPAEA
ncbi:MAG: pyruvate dehydrogenase (acetyl-transferring), homodimeric type [Chromatiales bacterium]|nr:pyruvate dehydrogenase (acetyl-transferring), homodimeric type [Chromatiales bacterium]